MALRLDKYLTELGAGTRSEVKKQIKAGLVTVNGAVAKKPEQKVDETGDEVCLRGERLLYTAFEYYLFHKPAGCVSATQDNMHRTVMDYLSDTARGDLFPVGRLDLDTEGLLLITNDGALAHALLSPSRHVAKTYYARVQGVVDETDVNLFKNGVDIGEEKLVRPADLVILGCKADVSEITLTITEGKFHQVKRRFEAVGTKVLYLKRISKGPVVLPEDLAPGAYRKLTAEELAALKNEQPKRNED